MSECLFCRIAAGALPSTGVYEDERYFCFMDIHPIASGHCLLIPKEHYQDVYAMPDELLGGLMIVAKRIAFAARAGLKAEGLNLIQSNGRAASQIIDHYHLHLLPRWSGDKLRIGAWESSRAGDSEAINAAAEKIRGAL